MKQTNQHKEIWKLLEEVPDPEIPVLTILDLGVVRNVEIEKGGKVIVTITPTYSGCPAMNTFETDVIKKLNDNGFNQVTVNTVYSPAWTTDWINPEALQKLKDYGIAPPIKGSRDKGVLFATEKLKVACPRCNSEDTTMVSQFGSTACKALYKCNTCLEPFDYFKCI